LDQRAIPLHNTDRAKLVTVHYPHHPLHGQSVRVRRRWAPGGCELLYCELADGTVATVPAWMTDVAVCSGVTAGDPVVEPAALLQLRILLDTLNASHASARVSAGVSEDTNEDEVECRVEAALPASDGEGIAAATGEKEGASWTVRKTGACRGTK